MGKAFDPPIPDNLVKWIGEQQVFFVATAPRSVNGHVNLSPKSAAQFRVVNNGRSVCYLDFTGSGSETSAHLMDTDGRITVMFVQLEEGAPRILRLFGRGDIITKDRIPAELLALFDGRDVNDLGFRWIIWIDLERVSTSCGYSIPIYQYVKERMTLREVTSNLGQEGMNAYRAKKNYVSIDGLFCNPRTGQLAVPTSIRWEDGFPLCYFDDQPLSKALPLPTRTHIWLSLRSLLWQTKRRLPFKKVSSEFLAGLLVGCTLTSIVFGRETLFKLKLTT